MRIGLDVMGGDYAPKAALDGVVMAIMGEEEAHDSQLLPVLFGTEEVLKPWAAHNPEVATRCDLVYTSAVIAMSESPVKAIQSKPDSSIVRGLRALATGEIQAFVSAGNTGAVYAGSLHIVGAVEGISRPALMSELPKEDGSTGVLLDVGANADCKPDTLHDFAILGSLYATHILGIESPRVGLLSLGSEAEKGNALTVATNKLLTSTDSVRFIGNIEGYNLFDDSADVVVTDGFTGNVILKLGESIYNIMKRRGHNDDYFRRYDFENYGATPILGIKKPVLVAHGVSTPPVFSRMFAMAARVVEHKLTSSVSKQFAAAAA